MRGLAASSVVARHFFAHLVDPAILALFDPGVFGVTVFFCVSGFIIPQSVRPGTDRLNRFVIARIFRLYPAYWISLIVGVAVYGGHFLSIAANATMLQRFFGAHDLLGVYWTLQVEIIFYIFVALTLVFDVFNRPRIVIGMALLNALIAVGFGMIRYYLGHKTPMHLPIGLSFILLGNAFGLMKAQAIPPRTMLALGSVVYMLLLVSFVFGFRRDWGDGESVSRYLITDTAALAFFYAFAVRERLNLRVLAWLGLISYPLYLLHEPIRVLAVRQMPPKWEIFGLFFALAAIILISAAMHYLVEQPFVRLGRRVSKLDWRKMALSRVSQPANNP